MSTPVPLVEGERLVPSKLSTWAGKYSELRLINSTKFKGVTYWWVQLTTTGGLTTLETFSIGDLRTSWVRKPGFYKIGKTYKFKGGGRLDTWKILDVYVIDAPAYGSSVKAVARMVTPDGLMDIQTLSQDDFDRMVEV